MLKVMLSQILDGQVRSVQLQLDPSRWCIMRIHSDRPLHPIATAATTFLITRDDARVV